MNDFNRRMESAEKQAFEEGYLRSLKNTLFESLEMHESEDSIGAEQRIEAARAQLETIALGIEEKYLSKNLADWLDSKSAGFDPQAKRYLRKVLEKLGIL